MKNRYVMMYIFLLIIRKLCKIGKIALKKYYIYNRIYLYIYI